MQTLSHKPASDPSSIVYQRCTVDLESGSVAFAEVPCQNLEDVLGGFGRSFQILAKRDIKSAYSSNNPLIMNTGLLTGTNIMTGLRTYFSAYSPLKQSSKRLPAAMWSAASGKFGSKLKWTGLDEVIFENRSAKPVYIVISEEEGGSKVELKAADHLLGLTTHEKIMVLQKQYNNAHFAAIGPAGENYGNVLMGAIALSTENQLKSGEDKCRFAGRGGMGSIMGSKNLLAIVAQSQDKVPPLTDDAREVNKEIIKGAGSNKYQPLKQGGGGGTWANYQVLQAFYATPEKNFRPQKNDGLEELFPENVAKVTDLKTEGCFRCGIRCHHNIHRQGKEGKEGEFLAKFDYEPLNLFGANLGILDGRKVGELIQRCDNLGMDAISLATTIAYVLDYNERHPDHPIVNGATFGEFEKVLELVTQTGNGLCPDIGCGVKRLSETLGDTDYAMHVKGLELPAYLPETNPGYAWSIAGGHMGMGTALAYAKDGDVSLEYWVNAITKTGLLQVGYDIFGLCKFIGVLSNHELIAQAIKGGTGLEVSQDDLEQAVRRSYFLGLALEHKQGFSNQDYTLPARVFDDPNPNIEMPNFVTRDFFEQLKARIWEVSNPEIERILKQL